MSCASSRHRRNELDGENDSQHGNIGHVQRRPE